MLSFVLHNIPWYNLHWWQPSVWESFSWENTSFLHFIWLLPVLWVIRWLLHLRQPKMPVSLSVNNMSFHAWSYVWNGTKHLPMLVFSLFLSLLLVSLARPQKTEEEVERWTEGIDIVLILDISESMKIEDFYPNRLEAAKKVAKEFITGRFQDRIGLVVFSGEAFSKSPLTTDYELLNSYIEDIDFGLIEKNGTAIGSALVVGTNRLRESKATSKVLILLSDGDNTAGNIEPVTAAEIAAAYAIKIYTIAVGKEGKVPYGKDMWGRTQYIENSLDETTLREIATIGKGNFYRASNNQALQQVFAQINEFEKSEIKENHFKHTTDYYPVYLKWGICFFLLFLFMKGSFLSNVLKD